jgi:hypothetical protein
VTAQQSSPPEVAFGLANALTSVFNLSLSIISNSFRPNDFDSIIYVTNTQIQILSVNARSLLRNGAEMQVQLDILQPHLFLVQESWLDPTLEDYIFTNYVLVARTDRAVNNDRGRGEGVASFRRSDLNSITLIFESIL